ncbi:MAG TPA: GNAT family N-acetyltransferase [Anaeromyxobacter sp.]|nr:GNAT family N-acetyltransferase [Anaeromyxobacter sp.]
MPLGTLAGAGARAKRRPPYRVETRHGRAALSALRPEWDALLARGPVDLPFLRHRFLEAWLDTFAPQGADLLVLAARDEAGEPVGFAPLLRQRRGGLFQLLAPANDHSCRVEWVLGPDASGAVAALWAHLRDRVPWDVLLLRDLPRDGPTSALLEPLARVDGHLTGRWESQRSPFLNLRAGRPEERLTQKFRANLRRRQRRLRERGAVALRREDGGGDPEAALGEFLALEASGWKGRRGSALLGDERLVRFYRAWAAEAAGRGALCIHALTLNGRPVAMNLGLLHRGTYYLPKTAYDEALGAVSPGQLLFAEVAAECQARGVAEIDFLGPDMEWKRDWAPEHRPHDWLYVYRPSLAGRALHALRHRLRPAVKEALRWRG